MADKLWIGARLAFQVEPNKHLNGRAIPMNMGKVLGGGSSINVMHGCILSFAPLANGRARHPASGGPHNAGDLSKMSGAVWSDQSVNSQLEQCSRSFAVLSPPWTSHSNDRFRASRWTQYLMTFAY